MNFPLIKSAFSLNCPKCRQGKLFEKHGLFVYAKVFKMNENCPNCGQRFEIEPGFWYGALWASYPLVLIVEMPFLFMALFSTLGSPWISFGLMFTAFIVFWPSFIRLGRSIWIHAWVKYKP